MCLSFDQHIEGYKTSPGGGKSEGKAWRQEAAGQVAGCDWSLGSMSGVKSESGETYWR